MNYSASEANILLSISLSLSSAVIGYIATVNVVVHRSVERRLPPYCSSSYSTPYDACRH